VGVSEAWEGLTNQGGKLYRLARRLGGVFQMKIGARTVRKGSRTGV